MTDCKSWVFHHWLYNLNNLFSWSFGDINSLWSLVVIVIFLPLTVSLLPPLSQPFDHLFSHKEHSEEVCVCVHECDFLCVYPRPLALCSIMCKAPHKPDQAETPGPFLHTLLSAVFFPFVPSVPQKKEREMGSYGGNYFREPSLSSIPPPPHYPHISIPLYPPHTTTTTTQHALKREGEDPLCLSPPFKQKTSSDLERPTTLLSCGCMCVYMGVCACWVCIRGLLFSLSDKALGHFWS